MASAKLSSRSLVVLLVVEVPGAVVVDLVRMELLMGALRTLCVNFVTV